MILKADSALIFEELSSPFRIDFRYCWIPLSSLHSVNASWHSLNAFIQANACYMVAINAPTESIPKMLSRIGEHMTSETD